MKGEEAVEIFKLVRQRGGLPQKLTDLVPLSFIGQAAVSFYREKIKLMDKLNVTEAQRKATLKDGQDAGEMLLDIESRIGELASKEPISASRPISPKAGFAPSGQPPKHERLGIPEKRMRHAQAISRHPDIVEKVKAQARENEDIPTRTAVINQIRYEEEKKRSDQANKAKTESKSLIAIEQVQYINKLDQIIHILPQQPPKDWNDGAFREAKTKAQIIIKRLEVFDGKQS